MDVIFRLIRDQEDIDLSSPYLDHAEILQELNIEFDLLSERVYNSCLIYFELKNIPGYILEFKKKYDELIAYKDKKPVLIDLYYTDIYQVDRSLVTKIIREHLYPFRAFASADEAHLTGLDYLEKILHSTNKILADRGIKPTKESDVYSNVKIVIEATFSNTKAQFLGGNHKVISQIAQCYIPDILIPDLNCAIEYKYAVDEGRLNTTMDQVLADVQGYSNHQVYTLFYAVFYVKTGAVTKDRFDQLWETKNFPSKWKPIFVEGPTYDKASAAKPISKANTTKRKK